MKILGFMPTLGRPPLVEQILMMWELQSHQDRDLLVLDTANQMPECTGDRWRIVHQGECPWSMGTCCNRGIRLLDSDAICRIDDDDVYFPWHLEACAAALEHHPWACSSSVWDRFDPGAPPARVRTHNDPTPVDVAYSGCWSFRRDAFEAVGGYPEYHVREQECEFRDRLLARFGLPGDTISDRFPMPSYYYTRGESGYVHYGQLTDEERLAYQRQTWPPVATVRPRWPANYLLGFPADPVLQPRPW